METDSWLKVSNPSLKGKLVAITGATGGLGSAMCRYLLSFGADILMINRSREKSDVLLNALKEQYPHRSIDYLLCDLSEMNQVRLTAAALKSMPIDILMLNAGTYAIPRALTEQGFDTVFAVNFLSHYYLVKELLPLLQMRKGKVIATGSIAHKFHPYDPEDPDFSHHEGANDIYGNSKRFLIFALMELLKNSGVRFAVGHPGISYTGITSHYPPQALKVVKPSMELIFMEPQQACRSMIRCIFEDVPYLHWMGPGYFEIWGNPVISPLKTCGKQERRQIFKEAEKMVQLL